MSESFWNFSVRTYHTAKVADACLSLQNERGIDVNMLLFCCWFGHLRGELNDDLFLNLLDFSNNWSRQVVKPLREVRTWMKQHGCADKPVIHKQCMSLRDKVKGVELSAEKMQQHVLADVAAVIPERDMQRAEQLDAIIKNIHHYFVAMNTSFDDFSRERLLLIILAAVVELNESDVTAVLSMTA